MLHSRLREASHPAIRWELAGIALLAGFIACTRHDPPSKTSSLTTAPATGSAVPSAAATVAGATSPTSARSAQRDKPKSAEACRQSCNGDWSAHGLAGVVSCLCRTSDSGRDCRDKAECQGECLLEPVRTELVSPGPPALGYFLGKCSEFVTTFGCIRRIQAGAKSQGPVDLSDTPPEICLD